MSLPTVSQMLSVIDAYQSERRARMWESRGFGEDANAFREYRDDYIQAAVSKGLDYDEVWATIMNEFEEEK